MINCETFQLKFICVLSTSTTHYQQVTINCCFLSKDISSYRAISSTDKAHELENWGLEIRAWWVYRKYIIKGRCLEMKSSSWSRQLNFSNIFFISMKFLACQFLWLLPLTLQCLSDRRLFTAIINDYDISESNYRKISSRQGTTRFNYFH